MAKAKKEQTADLSQLGKAPEAQTTPAPASETVNVMLPEPTTLVLPNTDAILTEDVLAQSNAILPEPTAPILPLQEQSTPEPEEQSPAVSDEIPTAEPMTETEKEAFAGIEKALADPVLPLVTVNQNELIDMASVVTASNGRKGIVIDYEKFVKFTYTLVTMGHNQGFAMQNSGVAGKNKLMNLLGITDRAEQEAKWEEFKRVFSNGK